MWWILLSRCGEPSMYPKCDREGRSSLLPSAREAAVIFRGPRLLRNPWTMHALARATLSLDRVPLMTLGQDARAVLTLALGEPVGLINPPDCA